MPSDPVGTLLAMASRTHIIKKVKQETKMIKVKKVSQIAVTPVYKPSRFATMCLARGVSSLQQFLIQSSTNFNYQKYNAPAAFHYW